MLPSTEATESFYAASLVALRALDARERARRFGADADARWTRFAGHLTTADRLDLLLRDAAGQWGAAFSPATVYRLPGLAADEPFGPDWASLSEARAQALWASDPGADLSSAAAALGLHARPVTLPPLAPTTRLLLVGPSAILAVARLFAADSSLSWPDQVLVVTERPVARHLAGLVAPLIGASALTRLVAPSDEVAKTLKAVGFSAGARAVLGPDDETTTAERAFAHSAGA